MQLTVEPQYGICDLLIARSIPKAPTSDKVLFVCVCRERDTAGGETHHRILCR